VDDQARGVGVGILAEGTGNVFALMNAGVHVLAKT
jgi:hypothetical protein